MDTQCFIGADISKLYFDVALITVTGKHKSPASTARFDNDAPGFKAFAKWLKSMGVVPADTLLVIENTGIYHRLIWEYCAGAGIRICIGNAAHIKWSLGITRGKNDKVDALRLCRYATKEADELKATPNPDKAILKLKDLVRSRTLLLKQLSAGKKYLAELGTTNDKKTQALMGQVFKDAIKGLEKSIKAAEARIKEIIEANEALHTNYKLLLSVPGIGVVTAVYMLCCTANFAARPSGKQLASYAGVVPFERQSGSATKGKPKVHHMANKELKRLLHMGARSAVQHYEELRTYYERKRAEGKHDLSVINAVKNKIVLRAVAVINNQQPYVHKLKIAA